MLTSLDDTPWHQLPTTFDHVGTSDPRFFDRLWFAASDRVGASGPAVHDRRVPEHERRRRRVRRHRRRAPAQPARVTPAAPGVRDGLRAAAHRGRRAVRPPPPARRRQRPRRAGRARLEGVARRPGGAPALQAPVGQGARGLQPLRPGRHLQRLASRSTASAASSTNGGRAATTPGGCVERVGITEPFTGEVAPQGAGLFAFLFYSTDAQAGHVQVVRGADGSRYLSAEAVSRATGEHGRAARTPTSPSPSSTTGGRDACARPPSM